MLGPRSSNVLHTARPQQRCQVGGARLLVARRMARPEKWLGLVRQAARDQGLFETYALRP